MKKQAIILSILALSLTACSVDETEQITLIEGKDLTCDIQVNTDSDNMSLKIMIINSGTEDIIGEDLFRYTASINGNEVFTQRESSLNLLSGANSTSTYPVPRLIYKYEDSGEISCTVDADNEFEEADESNNTVKTLYTF